MIFLRGLSVFGNVYSHALPVSGAWWLPECVLKLLFTPPDSWELIPNGNLDHQ